MVYQVKWSKLDISRSSILGLFDGKFINAISKLGEEFFLGFGHDRHNNRIIFIQSQTGKQYLKICETHMQIEQIASKIAYMLQENYSNDIMKYFDFKQLN